MITAPTEFSGLQVWLDASDTTRLFQLSGGTTAVAANGDPVGYWGDKSGNNRHFTNIGGSATTRPTWIAALSTVRFDGVDDFLSSIFSVNFNNQTVFLVGSVRTYTSSARVYGQVNAAATQDTGSSNFIPLVQTIFTNTIGTSIDSATTRASINLRSLSSYDIFSHVRTGGVLYNVINGISGTSYTSSNTTYTSYASRLGMGFTVGFGTTFNPSRVDISEVIVYNRALTNNERADVEYYLSRKWSFLNSIPRQVYGVKNGLWSLSDTWSVSAEPSPWNFPLSADNAYTNTFTITADSSTKVDTIRNSTLAPNILSGGSFVLANGVSLSANVLGGVAPQVLLLPPNVYGQIIGNVTGGTVGNASGITLSATSSLSGIGVVSGGSAGNVINPGINNAGNVLWYGNIIGGTSTTANAGMINLSGGNLTVYGNLSGNSNAIYNSWGLTNSAGASAYVVGIVGGGALGAGYNAGYGVNNSGNLYIIGTVTGSRNNINNYISPGIINNTTGVIFLTGDVYAGIDYQFSNHGITNAGNGIIRILGNLYSTATCNAINTTSTTPLSVYGNIINAPNGRQAIYAPRYQVFPTGSAQYTRQASNGYDSYVDYWTSNSTFSYPASSDVALGTTYSNSSLSGSMAVPSPSSVALGAFVGTTTGTASITLDNVLSQPISNLNTPNSIGARLKNITTSQALSAIAESLEF